MYNADNDLELFNIWHTLVYDNVAFMITGYIPLCYRVTHFCSNLYMHGSIMHLIVYYEFQWYIIKYELFVYYTYDLFITNNSYLYNDDFSWLLLYYLGIMSVPGEFIFVDLFVCFVFLNCFILSLLLGIIVLSDLICITREFDIFSLSLPLVSHFD